MVEVKFYDSVEDLLLKYAVIIARYQEQWVFVRHRDRDSWECPGGKREVNEDIRSCAARELWEESGASVYSLFDMGVYGVTIDGVETFGMLYFAEIYEFEDLPDLEIAEVSLFKELPDHWTYPELQPYLFRMIDKFIEI